MTSPRLASQSPVVTSFKCQATWMPFLGIIYNHQNVLILYICCVFGYYVNTKNKIIRAILTASMLPLAFIASLTFVAILVVGVATLLPIIAIGLALRLGSVLSEKMTHPLIDSKKNNPENSEVLAKYATVNLTAKVGLTLLSLPVAVVASAGAAIGISVLAVPALTGILSYQAAEKLQNAVSSSSKSLKNPRTDVEHPSPVDSHDYQNIEHELHSDSVSVYNSATEHYKDYHQNQHSQLRLLENNNSTSLAVTSSNLKSLKSKLVRLQNSISFKNRDTEKTSSIDFHK